MTSSCENTSEEHTSTSTYSTEGFEGPEKRLQVDFADWGGEKNLRSLPREVWDGVVGTVNGVILNSQHHTHYDAYLISESSLFVYSHRVVMLTCGTTTLLNALPAVVQAGKGCSLSVEFVQFSRKNFLFPRAQPAPHTSFDTEVAMLKGYYPEGVAHIMGPVDTDHWYCFTADYRVEGESGQGRKEQLLTVYMHDMDEDVASIFMYKKHPPSAVQVTHDSGIDSIFPDAVCSAHCFDPCGYSVNAVVGASYFTMHITPEPHCSYASFETNLPLAGVNDLVTRVLSLFRPRRAQTVIKYDAGAMYAMGKEAKGLGQSVKEYCAKSRVTNELENGCKFVVTNYTRV